MKIKNWVMGCFVASVAATLSTAGIAATKQFDISVTSSGSTTTLTYLNGSTGGSPANSSINSFWFTSPYKVSNVTLQPSRATQNTTISPASCATALGCGPGVQISITYLTGFGPGTSTSVTMTGSPPSTVDSCTATFPWSAQAFSGNALGGVNFLAPGGVNATATTSQTVSCVLQFLTQPANAAVGANITSVAGNDNSGPPLPAVPPVQVRAMVGGSVATGFTGNVTLSIASNPVPPASAALTGGGPVNATAGVAAFGTPATALSLNKLGNYKLTATAAAGSGFLPATSDQFKIFAGVLNCGDPFGSNFINPGNIAPDQPGYAAGGRSGFNKDGVDAECVPVLYTFVNSILMPPTDTVQLSWDTVSQPNAAFLYTMNWKPRTVGTTNPGAGWPLMPRPFVAWLNTDGSNASIQGTPSFIPALACLSSKLPAPYGTLQSDLAANGTTITVTGIAANPQSIYLVPAPGSPAVPATPFPIVIANTDNVTQFTTTERLTAASIVAGSVSPDPTVVGPTYAGTYTITYNVTRGTVTEGGSTPAFHKAGTRVVSTPLPIIPDDATTFPAPYVVKRQAQMCVADHKFRGFTLDATGTAQVLWTTTVFDIGDGWVSLK